MSVSQFKEISDVLDTCSDVLITVRWGSPRMVNSRMFDKAMPPPATLPCDVPECSGGCFSILDSLALLIARAQSIRDGGGAATFRDSDLIVCSGRLYKNGYPYERCSNFTKLEVSGTLR